mgnify:CR=1 FL=1
MDSKERISLIRKGNEHFNRREMKQAIEIFVATGYRDGLTRIGDYYYFDKRQPLIAVRFYKMAGVKARVDEIYERMIMALGQWLGGEKAAKQPPRVQLPPLKVSPKLKILAEEILRKQESEK